MPVNRLNSNSGVLRPGARPVETPVTAMSGPGLTGLAPSQAALLEHRHPNNAILSTLFRPQQPRHQHPPSTAAV